MEDEATLAAEIHEQSPYLALAFTAYQSPPCPAPAPTPCMNDQLISLSLHVHKSDQNVDK